MERVAIVTGGASGIGRALCMALGSRGARVVVADIRDGGAHETARKITAAGGSATAEAVDVTDRAQVVELVERTAKEHGRIDLMFNNAGIAIIGDAFEMTPDQWDRIIDVNFRGVVHGTMAAYERMRAQRSGHIVNTASVAGLVPVPSFVAYCATKHAVVGLSTTLRMEAARHGVRVSAVCPGVIDTPMVQDSELMGGLDRAKMLSALPVKPYDVDDCARDVLAGVDRNDALIVVTRSAKLLHRLYRWAPGIATLLRGEIDRRIARAQRSS
jgi:NAD(P)-dependent dehydrogenase (short-subunit alcohol dehydrogenase family)